jgi:putative oxidoreductase
MRDFFYTEIDYVCTLLRVVAGIIVFPYGMQKLFGWFGGPGFRTSVQDLKSRRVPLFIALLVIIGQSVGSIALIAGFMGRFAAAGIFIIYTGAMITHLRDGWMMNWFGNKKGEGIEYFVMLLALLSVIIIKGSGALSLDLLLFH